MDIRTQFAKVALLTAASALLLCAVGCGNANESAEGQNKAPVTKKGVKKGGKMDNQFIATE